MKLRSNNLEKFRKKANKAYWGYIFMNSKGEFKHRFKRATRFKSLDFIRTIKEAVLTGLEIKYSPRKMLPYQGMLVWQKGDDNLCAYSIKTRAKTTPLQVHSLYKEFESLAKIVEKDEISALVAGDRIPHRIMTRLGWEYVGKEFCHRYQKKLTT